MVKIDKLLEEFQAWNSAQNYTRNNPNKVMGAAAGAGLLGYGLGSGKLQKAGHYLYTTPLNKMGGDIKDKLHSVLNSEGVQKTTEGVKTIAHDVINTVSNES